MWWFAYYHRGREHRESSGSTDRKVALRRLKERLREVGAAQLGLRPFGGPAQERRTLADLLQDLERDHEIHGRKSLPQLRSHLRHVRAFFGPDRALTVTPDRLRRYIAHRQQEGAAPATINRETEAVARAFTLAVESGMLVTAPHVPSLPERNARQGFFERGEFEAVLQRLPDADVKDFCEWFYRTGMRPGEIRSLTWADLDRETWALRLHARGAKTGYGRTIPLEGPLRTIIERRLGVRVLHCQHIFSRSERQMGDFGKTWNRACQAAGQSGKLLYDLRRTAVRNMVRAGVDPSVAMKISGHRTRAVFDRYNIIDERDLRYALAKTHEYVDSLSPTQPLRPLQRRQPT
jgi:integrase